MIIHSTNNTIRPMMIQVMAVEDIRGAPRRAKVYVGRCNLWRSGDRGKRAFSPAGILGNAISHRSLPPPGLA
jgi:hypothetical protein